MNFLALLGGGGGGGGGQSATSSARSTAGAGMNSIGIQSQDLVWIAVAFAAALTIVGLLWVAFRK